ncbi:hypothetical protein NPIL_51121 [Nephila pilipes]|uniref:Uncharacterized protein n=1 Tax=Nephila pilipes TaxID=299642 RepID=A0A8X6TYH9_NEPPI|nr:hypothetical protein NPIL_51121 [Nephila pilipes]
MYPCSFDPDQNFYFIFTTTDGAVESIPSSAGRCAPDNQSGATKAVTTPTTTFSLSLRRNLPHLTGRQATERLRPNSSRYTP